MPGSVVISMWHRRTCVTVWVPENASNPVCGSQNVTAVLIRCEIDQLGAVAHGRLPLSVPIVRFPRCDGAVRDEPFVPGRRGVDASLFATAGKRTGGRAEGVMMVGSRTRSIAAGRAAFALAAAGLLLAACSGTSSSGSAASSAPPSSAPPSSAPPSSAPASSAPASSAPASSAPASSAPVSPSSAAAVSTG